MSAKPQRLRQTGKRQKILVAGAGMSGLVAALELEHVGHDVTIIEARDRVGGRVHTQRGSDGTPIAEAGAGRIPRSHHWTLDYISRMGLALHPLYPPKLTSLAFINGQRCSLDRGAELAQAVALPENERALGYAGIVKTYLLDNVDRLLAAGVIDTPAWPPEQLADLDRLSVPDYLAERGLSQAAVKLLTLGAFPTAISPLMLSRVLAHYDRDGLSIIEDGNDSLPKAIAARLRGDILLGTPVLAVSQFSDRVEVTVTSEGRTTTMTADALICTIPYSVLPTIRFEPLLSPAKRQILAEMRYVKVAKVAFRMRSRFWEAEHLSGFAQLDTGAEIWSPQWPSNGHRGVLQLYQQGDRVAEMDALSEPDRMRWAIEKIEEVFPGADRHVEECVSYSWQLDPWARGAYGIPYPGDLFRWKGQLAGREGRIHFAGEHTSEYPAWIEGAVRSGHSAASEVNEAGS